MKPRLDRMRTVAWLCVVAHVAIIVLAVLYANWWVTAMLCGLFVVAFGIVVLAIRMVRERDPATVPRFCSVSPTRR